MSMKFLTSRLAKAIFVLFSVLSLNACSFMSTTKQVAADIDARWALLPINNLSQTAQADAQALTLLETQLRRRGVTQLHMYTPLRQVNLRNLLDPSADLDNAMQWAKSNRYRYALTGSVNEWQYKAGADREPAVGISLKLVDLYSDGVVWQANAARTGWGYATLSTVADKVISQLLQEIQLRAPSP